MTTALERFLKYVTFGTASDEGSDTCPSTPGQLVLGEYLAKEMDEMGMDGAHMDADGYVYGFIPASKGWEEKPAIGLVAHMDTSPDAPGDNVKPRIITYNGGDIVLENGDIISEADYPAIKPLAGQDLVVTDGTTLLGSDDKAGVSEIMAACQYLLENPEVSHPAISVCFTPDEEIGSGADRFDIEKFGARWAYTVDGGALGEIEYENFNGASAEITVNGVNIHPGEAKGRMKNAVLIASQYISMLPAAETPATTEGYEGFYHVADIEGCESKAVVRMIIRDHDKEKFEARKSRVKAIADYLNGVYGEGTVEAKVADSYYNMKEKILPHMHIVEDAQAAMKKCGVEPKIIAIRGGTDGARLSFMGLPCPNLSTGGINFHSTRELIPVKSLEKMTEVIVTLVSLEK